MIKKYRVIAKTGKTNEAQNFKKWKCNNLVKFTAFLDKNYPDWCYFNVYEYRKGERGIQLESFTKNKRPTSAWTN